MPRYTAAALLAGEPARIIDAAARRAARQLYHTGLTAEDARQSLLEALLTRQAEWQDAEPLAPLIQAILNGYVWKLGRDAHRERRSADITDIAEMEISDGAPAIEVQAAVQRALDRLPPDRAAVVVLVIAGHGTEEAAAIRGTTRKAVRVAMDHFRRLFDGEAEEK